MILTRSPHVLLSLVFFMMAAAIRSYLMHMVVVTAVVPFETRDELKTAVDQYCDSKFDPNMAYG